MGAAASSGSSSEESTSRFGSSASPVSRGGCRRGAVLTRSLSSFKCKVMDNIVFRWRQKKDIHRLQALKRNGGGALRTRASKGSCRLFRQMISSWCLNDLHCLVVEFEAAMALRNLAAIADVAKPKPNSVRGDLSRMLRGQLLTDVRLSYKGMDFFAHRCILRRRSRWFASLLDQYRCSPRVPLPDNLAITTREFENLLDFIYTGEIIDEKLDEVRRANLLLLASSELCVTNDLFTDIQSMYVDPDDGDAILIFSSEYEDRSRNLGPSSERSPGPTLDQVAGKPLATRFRCHSVILAARSQFFCSLVTKWRKDPYVPSQDSSKLLEICLDEKVIPRYYGSVLLEAMYTDRINIIQASKFRVQSNSLSEVQAIASGQCALSPIEEAMELFQIGRFLDFPMLALGCELVIASGITLDTLPQLYNWSVESYGSDFVRRCCVALFAQNYVCVAESPAFLELSESLLMQALKSDFVQATEAEILESIVQWGEHQITLRFEKRDPDVSLAPERRRGSKRSSTFDAELKLILRNLLPLVRLDFILPNSHPVLVDAMSRGLVTGPADFSAVDNVDSAFTSDSESSSKLIYERWSGSSQRQASQHPRLYLPYYEEAHKILEKRVAASPDQLVSLINHHPPVDFSSHIQEALSLLTSSSSVSADAAYNTIPVDLSQEMAVPNAETISLIRKRSDEILLSSALVKRGLACGCSYHKSAVMKQVRLRVIRELGLEDSVIVLLDDSSRCWQDTRYSKAETARSERMPGGHSCCSCPPRGSCASLNIPTNAKYLSPNLPDLMPLKSIAFLRSHVVASDDGYSSYFADFAENS